MPDLIHVLRTGTSTDPRWKRAVTVPELPIKGDHVALWGTRETFKTNLPHSEVRARMWLTDGTLVAILADLNRNTVQLLGGANEVYEKLRAAGWEQIDE